MSVRLGCAAEAVVIAAALSAPQMPFREVYPFHFDDRSEYGLLLRDGHMSRRWFDDGRYSEPMMVLSALSEWSAFMGKNGASIHKRKLWCQRNALVDSKLQNIASTARSIRCR